VVCCFGLCVKWGRGRGCFYIRFSYMFVYMVVFVVKVLKSFKFDPEIYGVFKGLVRVGGCSVTGAFERFMGSCVEGGVLVFPDRGVEGFEVEARVLVDWLGKGRRFYRVEGGGEVNISGRLVWLLPKVRDAKLRCVLEETLKDSVSIQE
jgi:hypothetical protein